jgi:hypothetical protein
VRERFSRGWSPTKLLVCRDWYATPACACYARRTMVRQAYQAQAGVQVMTVT